MKIVPAILGSNQEEVQKQFEAVAGLTDLISYDVADGHFVPSITPQPLDYPNPQNGQQIFWHLMVDNPQHYLNECLTFPSRIIAVHVESKGVTQSLAILLKSDVLSGLVFNPETKVSEHLSLIQKADLVQVMTVKPGEQGNDFIAQSLDKIPELKKIKDNLLIAVDGGINLDTIEVVMRYQPDYIVVGSFLTKVVGIKENFEILEDIIKNQDIINTNKS